MVFKECNQPLSYAATSADTLAEYSCLADMEE